MFNQKTVNVKGFSPRYTAPEVFGRMSTNVTAIMIEDEMKGDVYSYSLILWEMMSRKIPWVDCKFSNFEWINFTSKKKKKKKKKKKM